MMSASVPGPSAPTLPILGRSRRGRGGVCVAVLGLLLGSPGLAAAQVPVVTDESVDAAIQRAVTWIEGRRNADGHWESKAAVQEHIRAGDTGLAVLSLLYAGRDPRETALDRALTWFAEQALQGTYTHGLRAHVLALVPGKKFRGRLEEDLAWLLRAVGPRGTPWAGSYDYDAPPDGGLPSRWDNSNSQFGVLGAWLAADAGLPVPETYWEAVAEHWIRVQNTDGGWGYEQGDTQSRGSMTAAGLAALFVVLDQRYAAQPREAVGLLTAIELGLDWFGREYTPENPRGDVGWTYYYLYGVERVGAASGYKAFRNKEWFRSGAAYLLAHQQADGSWPMTGDQATALRNTAFAVMFLCHGRAPLMFNKLAHGPDWDRKLRDLSGLTRYAGHTFEKVLNWQIVRLDGPLDDLLEAPVLYLYGEQRPEFNAVEIQKLREYCQRGGLLFGVAGRSGEAFREGFEDLARRVLPDCPLRPLESSHPLLSGEVQFRIEDPPLLLEAHNGVRTLMLLSTRDLADAWNRYVPRGALERDFQLAANVYHYATDKTSIRSRLQTATIVERDVDPTRTIRVARIKYNGRWDVEPYGWTRLRLHLNNEAATRLLVTSGITLDSPELKSFSIAYLTGTDAFELGPSELRGLREFLSGGGTLLADAAGGSRAFTRSLQEQVQLATYSAPETIPAESYILTGRGIPDAQDLAGATYRRAARAEARGQSYPRLVGVRAGRRLSVIHSPLDLSTGLLGTPVYNVRGYEPETTLRIMRNLLLYAALPSAEKARLERE